MSGYSKKQLTDMANAIRALSIDAVQQANSGHPGMPMGMADVATVLFSEFLRFNPSDPDWADRDRFVLSAGHGSMLLYALLHLTGYPEMTMDEIRNFRQLHAKTAGHPEYGHAPGIETTTGPLGQGLATAVGMALAERMMHARFGTDLVDHYTWVIAGDGCLMEGISQEAISLAGHLKLNKLVVLFDDNGITIDGSTALSTSDDHLARCAASGWNTCRIDGHDYEQIRTALADSQKANAPTLIACKTIIGFGSPNKQGSHGVHGAPLGDEEIALTKKNIGWTSPAFTLPNEVAALWQATAERGQQSHSLWQQRLQACDEKTHEHWGMMHNRALPLDAVQAIDTFKQDASEQQPAMASRKSSEAVLNVLSPYLPWLIGGSADLTGSNNTKAGNQTALTAENYSGDYIYYGIREHGMAAAMNGLALHGGMVPYGGTFFVFTDYCRPAIRLSALMKQQVIYVMTHDSIGLGEDGPTHQPIEHLASLRAMPGVLVMRPADTVETAECWQIALERHDMPSVLVLTRQNLPTLRLEPESRNLCALGAYPLTDSEHAAITLLATGSEVHLAMQASEALRAENITARVVSMPSWELFEEQSDEYKTAVLGSAPRLAIEAAVTMGWSRYTGSDDQVMGIDGFGASAPAVALFEHYGLTVDHICAKVKKLVNT